MESIRAPCVRCGNILHTGEGKVTVSFSLDELGRARLRDVRPVRPEAPPVRARPA
jgi:hypothetical protein